MENYRVYLQDTVKESNDQLINDLSKMKSIVDKSHRELQSRIDMLGGAVVSKDITVLTETVTDVSEAEPVITGVKKIQDLFQLEDTLVGSCVSVEKVTSAPIYILYNIVCYNLYCSQLIVCCVMKLIL